jgi:hypothetical protein
MLLGQTSVPAAPNGAVAAILYSSLALGQPASAVCADEVIARAVESEAQQEKNLQHYRTVREYHLANGDGSRSVQVLASVVYDANGAKTISLLQESGSEGIFRRVIRKVLEAEERASREDEKEMRLGPENYDFKLLGTESRDGRNCYVLQLLPKRKSKYLLDGKAWVDAKEFAVVRIEGRPSASLGFWVGKPYISQSFEKAGNIWFMAHNESLTNARLFGKVVFSMQTTEVQSGGTKVAINRPSSAKSKSGTN